jgi:hypothetical protein
MPYTQIQIKQQDPITAQGTSEWTFVLTGAGLPAKTVSRVFSDNVPNAELQTWAYQQSLTREGVEALFARLSVGQTFPIVAPSAPVLTAEQVWRAKVARYLQGKQLALTNATAISDLNALFADINATYLPVYL